MLHCYAVRLISILSNNVTTTGSRECVYLHAQNLAKTKEIELMHQMWPMSGALVSGAFRPEPLQNRSKSIDFYSVRERFRVPLWGH